ncbi:MAG: ribosome maturation factor RimM [Ignavibacteriaceae bacterium]
MDSQFYLIARIDSAFGNNGYFRIHSFSDFPERFLYLKKVFIDFWGDKKIFFVEDSKVINRSIVLKFKNFDNAEDLKELMGKEIYVDQSDVVILPENTYFIHDLIGSTIYSDGELIGKIEDVLNAPANDIYVVRKNDGSELLIPAVKEFIVSFDPGNKILIMKRGGLTYEDDEN